MSYQVPQYINGNKIFLVNRSEIEGRLDPSVYKPHFKFVSKAFRNVKLSEIAWIDPSCMFKNIEEVSFIPMDAIDSSNGIISYQGIKKVEETKGFTRFKEGDILWAKITPCMQNAKSAIAKKLINGYGCGSTEFFVIRSKDKSVVLQEYLLFLLRDERILKTAMNYFGGSAGQQRVSPLFLKTFNVPLPEIEEQKRYCELLKNAQILKRQKEQQAEDILNSIDDYLLGELGIELPEMDLQKIQDRVFIVRFGEICNGRFDPKLYSIPVKQLKQSLYLSPFDKQPLKYYIKNNCSGEWGKDESEEVDDNKYTKCLVIRATEFDNTYNLRLDNSRVKYRWIENSKLSRMNIQPNDLLIEKSGGSEDQPVGRISILTDEILKGNQIAYSNFIHKIIVDGINPMYLYFYLRTMYNIKITDSMQSQTNGIRNLIMQEYFDQIIVVPPLQKQQEIVNRIMAMRQQAKSLQEEGKEILKQAKQKVESMIICK